MSAVSAPKARFGLREDALGRAGAATHAAQAEEVEQRQGVKGQREVRRPRAEGEARL